MKKIIFKYKYIVLVGILVILVLISSFIILPILFKEKSNEDILHESLVEYGEKFYEEYYFTSLHTETKSSFLSNYTDIGIKIDLDNLETYFSEDGFDEIFVNNLTEEVCDFEETKIIIYPKSPFGVDDYTLEATVSCGYESK